MSEWIPYEGKGEKPEWLPDDCLTKVRLYDGLECEPHPAGDKFWWKDNIPRERVFAFKIVDERYQHLAPPTYEISFDNLVMPSGERVAIPLPITTACPAHVWTEKAEEAAPVWPLEKWNVYRGAELLGTVEIEERPGMTRDEQKFEAASFLRCAGACVMDAHGLSLRRVTASTGRRRGFIR